MPSTARTRRKGRSKYVPTDQDRRTVAAMIGVGIDQNAVCAVLEITVPTLHRHFRRELDTSYTKLVARMRARLIAKADAGDPLCLIHVNKVLGWNDRLIVQDAADAEFDPSTMTDAEIAQRISRLSRKAAVGRIAKPPGAVH